MDEVQKLILQVEGEAKLKDLTVLLDAQKKTMQQIIELQKSQALTGGQTATLQRAAAGAIDTQKNIVMVQGATRGLMNAQGMMQLGYALQDFTATQGGFAQKFLGISNNLQMLAMSMGVGGGWFIAISGIIAALQGVAANWSTIEALFKDMPDPEKVKKAAEFQKAQQDRLKDVLGQVTPDRTAAAGAAQEAITAIGGPAIASKLEESLAASGAPWSDQQKWAWGLKNAGKFRADDEAGFNAALAQAEAADKRGQAQTRLRDLLNTATGTTAAAPGARAELEAIMRANPARFTPGDIANFTRRAGGKDEGPPVPEMDEKRFADLQRQLEAREPGPGMGFTYGGRTTAGAGAVVPPEGLTVPGTMPKQAGAPLIQAPQPQRKRRRYLQTAPEHFGLGGMTQPEMQQGTMGETQQEIANLQQARAVATRAAGFDAQLGKGGGGVGQYLEMIDAKLQAAQRKLSEQANGFQYSASPSYY